MNICKTDLVKKLRANLFLIRLFFVKHGFALSLILPGVSYILFFTILICFSLINLSLRDQVNNIDQYICLANYLTIIQSPEFRESLVRTIAFVTVGIPLQLLAGLVCALIVNKEFSGRGIVRSLFLIPIAIPGLVTAIIVSKMLFQFPGGHINDLLMGNYFLPPIISEPVNWYHSQFFSLGLALCAKIWRDMPISMLILLAGLQSVPKDHLEAAKTMGAGSIRTFFYIIVPHPNFIVAISAVLVLRSIEIWKAFLFPYVIAPTYQVLGVLIEYLYHEESDPGQASALAVILMALIFIAKVLIEFITKKVKKHLIKV